MPRGRTSPRPGPRGHQTRREGYRQDRRLSGSPDKRGPRSRDCAGWCPRPARAKSTSTPRQDGPQFGAHGCPQGLGCSAPRQQNREHARAGGKPGKMRFPEARHPPPLLVHRDQRPRGAPPRASTISRHRSRTWGWELMFRENRTTPPTSPRASHRAGSGEAFSPRTPPTAARRSCLCRRACSGKSITAGGHAP